VRQVRLFEMPALFRSVGHRAVIRHSFYIADDCRIGAGQCCQPGKQCARRYSRRRGNDCDEVLLKNEDLSRSQTSTNPYLIKGLYFPTLYIIILPLYRSPLLLGWHFQEYYMLGKYCRVSVSRPIGSVDTAYGFEYPVNFGYATGKRIQLPEHTGAYILGIHHPVREFEGRIIAILTNTNTGEKTLVVSPKSKRFIVHEIEQQLAALKDYFPFELDCLYERSSGAVVFHEIGGVVRYLLIKNRRSAHWSFPKGHVEEGETDEQAAMREVKEETGIDIHILEGFKAKSEYSIQHKIEKVVYIYAATCENPKTSIQEEEIEDYLWLDFGKAMKHLKFENDKNILHRVNDFLKKNNYI